MLYSTAYCQARQRRVMKRPSPGMKSPRTQARCTLALITVVAAAISFAAEKPKEQAAELLARAAAVSDLEASGVPPFWLRAQLFLLGKEGKPAKGGYVLLWTSPTRWREEISLGDYRRVRVGGQDKFFQRRSVDYEPLRVFQLDGTLHFVPRLQTASEGTLGKVQERPSNGRQMNCIEIGHKGQGTAELCLDAVTGALVREEYQPTQDMIQPDVTAREYSEFLKWGGKMVPGVMRAWVERKLVVEVKVLEITPAPAGDPALFAPPVGAEQWARCEKPELPALDNAVPPRYPKGARQQGLMGGGVAAVYAVIGTDGLLSNMQVVESVGKDFDVAMLETMRHWRYQPMKCHGVPVAMETVFRVFYLMN